MNLLNVVSICLIGFVKIVVSKDSRSMKLFFDLGGRISQIGEDVRCMMYAAPRLVTAKGQSGKRSWEQKRLVLYQESVHDCDKLTVFY